MKKQKSLIPVWPLYQLLWLVLTPLLHVLYLWMALSHRSLALYRQRLGWQLPSGNSDLWIHAASVGEVSAILPLIARLTSELPQLSLLVSCNTPTGYSLLRKRLPAPSRCCYMPLDKRSNMRRILQRVQPRCMVIMETEIWPNLYRQLHRQSIPLLIVNARISQTTLAAPLWIRTLYRDCLQSCHAILARCDTDRQRFIELGAEAKRCQTVGNIKFHMPILALSESPPAALIQRPYILLASTHHDEEYQICQTLLKLKNPPLLVVAPRHPNRAAKIVRELKTLDPALAQRSKNQAVVNATRIYVADTLGELNQFIRHALFVVMGGSFINLGGHNILEVAAAKKAVICGRYMQQFADETELLASADGLRQCDDYQALATLAEEWIKQPQLAEATGQRAYQCMLSQQHILDDYVSALHSFIAASS